MKQKFLPKLLLVATLLLCSLYASAYDFSAENDDGVTIYYSIISSSAKTVEVTYGGTRYSATDSYVGDIVIPETVSYRSTFYSVTEIGVTAFENCTDLTSIYIPNSVTTIGGDAFWNCTGLTGELRIPDSVISIGYNAFFFCQSLTSLDLGNSVTTIGEYAFSCCSGLTGELKIPDSVTTIGKYAFQYCRGLTGELKIPDSVTSIGWSAFMGCEGLTSVTIPNSVTEIEGDTFYFCTGLKNAYIPNSVTKIGAGAFDNCKNMKAVYSYNLDPPVCGGGAFNITYQFSVLYVPAGSKDAYKEADEWKKFSTIYDELDGIESVSTSSNGDEVMGYYTIDGKAVDAPQRGVNIVRYSDGTTKKVMMK